MNLINRTALIVIPQQPYIDWANSLDELGPKLDINSPLYEYTIYLVDNVVRDTDFERVLKQRYAKIFEQELEAWHLDRAAWPKKRDFQTFRKWFEVKTCSMVLDLSKDRIQVEELNGG